jgi:AcrR family transcriptional regulator
MPRKQARGEDTSARLLDAALAVHASEGPAGFGVHAVIAESGVSLGSLYHHFGSFDGLAAALFARCLGELLDALADALEGVTTARAGVTAIVREYLAFTRDHRDKALFIHASSYAGFVPAHAAAITAATAPRVERLVAWLRPHVERKIVVELPEPLYEMLVIGPVAEVARRWLAGDPRLDLDEAARVLPERIWRSLRRPARVAPARAR